MTVFAYTALDRAGKRTTGTIPAETRAALVQRRLAQRRAPCEST